MVLRCTGSVATGQAVSTCCCLVHGYVAIFERKRKNSHDCHKQEYSRGTYILIGGPNGF
jgi:hypothetical protein